VARDDVTPVVQRPRVRNGQGHVVRGGLLHRQLRPPALVVNVRDALGGVAATSRGEPPPVALTGELENPVLLVHRRVAREVPVVVPESGAQGGVLERAGAGREAV